MTDDRLPLAELLQKAGDGDSLRSVAEAVLQLLMESDVEGLIGAARHERSAERMNRRNGYRERALDTRLGTLQLRVPKLRQAAWCMDRTIGGEEPAGVGEGSLADHGCPPCRSSRTRIAATAFPGRAQGHELAGLRGRVTSARQPDGLVHRRGARSLGGGTTHDPRRPALVLAPGDPDGADLACGVPPGVPADRGADRLRHRPARAGAARAGPYHPQSARGDAGGAAAAAAVGQQRGRALASPRRQHRPEAVRARRVVGRETRHPHASVLEKVAPGRGRRRRPDPRLHTDRSRCR
jgi:hypothetical protein